MAELNSHSNGAQAQDTTGAQGAGLAARIASALTAREEQGTLRKLRVRGAVDEAAAHLVGSNGVLAANSAATPAQNPGNENIFSDSWRDLSGNDYLRLSRHPQVVAAAVSALGKWGVSSSGSPLISGYTSAHRELEERLCTWSGFGHGLVWNTGYAANQAVLSTLPQRGDIVLADRLIHNSMVAGLVHSGARLQRYRHCDIGHLEALLAQYATGGRQVFVVTESVFSMDGDYPDLRHMAALKERYGFFWIVDEAHALGWYGTRGSGLAEHCGVAAAVDVLVGTLGKGLGAMGAYTLFHDASLRAYLINFAGEFIYSTYLAPACAAAASAAVDIVEAGGAAERARLHALSRSVREILPGAPDGDSPIVPVLIGGAVQTLAIAERLRVGGFSVGAVRPPTVPEGGSRLRLSLHAQLTAKNIATLAQAIKEAMV